jgi:Ca2+-binding RTX toxin-like protein
VFDPAATLAEYETLLSRAPQAAQPTMRILIDLMKRGKLPVLMPVGEPTGDQNAPRGVRPLFREIAGASGTRRNRDCEALIIGRPEGDTVKCAFGNHFFVMGPGQDVVEDSWGDDILNPGAGDDVLSLGWGNDILVLEAGWGNDIISKTCHNSRLSAADRARLGWTHEFVNFIVFGPGVQPADVKWETKTILVHEPSKSRLTINGHCFSLVFTEDGELKAFEEPRREAAAPPQPVDRAAQLRQMQQQWVRNFPAGMGNVSADLALVVDRATYDELEKQSGFEAQSGAARVVRQGQRLYLVFYTNVSRGMIEIRARAQ